MGLYESTRYRRASGTRRGVNYDHAPVISMTGNGRSSAVKLFICPPHEQQPQYLRPLTFNFNDSMIDDLRAPQLSSHAVASFRGNDKSNLRKAILPTTNGLPTDTAWYESLWSFILVFDGGKRNVADSRTILTGYFTEEPVVEHTMRSSNPVFNLDAMLVFTHNSSMIMQQEFNSRGAQTLLATTNADIIPDSANKLVHGEATLTDAGTIAACNVPTALGERISADAHAYVSSYGDRARVASACTRSPKAQLLTIAKAMDTATTHTECSTLNRGSLAHDPYQFDDFDTFVSAMYSNIGSEDVIINTNGIDPAVPMTLGQLDALFPDIEPQCLNIAPSLQFDIRDTGEISISNTMSALTQSIVSMVACEYGISEIDFTYGSYVAHDICNVSKGAWEVSIINSMMSGGAEVREDTLLRSGEMFKQALEDQLFPTLLELGGEFILQVYYNATDNTIIDLQFLDEQEEDGYYSVDNRLGGLLSPAIGDVNSFTNNKNQLTYLTNVVGSEPTTMNNQESIFNDHDVPRSALL